MHAYRITGYVDDESPAWAGTLSDAHASLKLRQHMPDARIELFDVPTDKDGVLTLLSNRGVPACVAVSPMRTWALTPRGGLTEVPNGE